MRLYVEGHLPRQGYAISRSWSDAECSALPLPDEGELKPVRFVRSRKRAFEMVERWNRRFATHYKP